MSAASLHAGMEYYHRNESRGSRVKYSSPSNSDDASSLLANPSALPFSLCPSLAWGPTNAKPNSRSTITWNRARRKEKRRKNNLKFCPPQATPAPAQRHKKPDPGRNHTHTHTNTHTITSELFIFFFLFRVKTTCPKRSSQPLLNHFKRVFPARRQTNETEPSSRILLSHPPFKKRTTLVTEAFPC